MADRLPLDFASFRVIAQWSERQFRCHSHARGKPLALLVLVISNVPFPGSEAADQVKQHYNSASNNNSQQ